MNEDEEGINKFFKGLMFALLLSTPIWVLVLVLLYLIWGT